MKIWFEIKFLKIRRTFKRLIKGEGWKGWHNPLQDTNEEKDLFRWPLVEYNPGHFWCLIFWLTELAISFANLFWQDKGLGVLSVIVFIIATLLLSAFFVDLFAKQCINSPDHHW